jgi:hypothetical protein
MVGGNETIQLPGGGIPLFTLSGFLAHSALTVVPFEHTETSLRSVSRSLREPLGRKNAEKNLRTLPLVASGETTIRFARRGIRTYFNLRTLFLAGISINSNKNFIHN